MDALRQQVLRLAEVIRDSEAYLTPSASHAEKVQAFSVLFAEIEKVRSQQAGRKFLTWKREEHFDELLAWIDGLSGGDASKVVIKDTGSSGYGVFAKVPVAQEDAAPVIRVPHTACLTPAFASTFVLGRCLELLGLPDNLKLVGILMSEATHLNESVWKPYIQCLPVDFGTIMHLDTACVRRLEGSVYLDDALRRYCNICKHYMNSVIAVDLKVASKADKKKFGSLFTFDLFRWALDVVMTRSNQVPLPGSQEPVLALVPLLEMVNHGTNKDKFSSVCDEHNNFFAELRLSKSVGADEEILMSYSPLSVKNRFINHGFTTPEESVFQFFIDLQVGSEETVREVVDDCGLVLQRNDRGNYEYLAEFLPAGDATDLTLIVLRACTAIRDALAKKEVPRSSEASFELALEKQMFATITRTATELLKKYPVSPELVSDGESSSEKNKAVLQLCRDEVAAEKLRLQRIISFNSEQLKAIVKLLVSKARDAASAAGSS